MFKNEYSQTLLSQRILLAKKMVELGKMTTDDDLGRFVALKEAARLAAGAGDVNICFQALGILAEKYDIDIVVELQPLVELAAKSTRSRQKNREIAEAALKMVVENIRRDEFEAATSLSEIARASALTARDADLVKETGLLSKQLADLTREYEDLSKDADGILTGRYLCLVKGNWTEGIRRLSRTKADYLAVAALEATEPTEGKLQAELGDLWWSIGEKEEGVIRILARHRSRHWFRAAQSRLKGLSKAVVDKKLAEPPKQLSETIRKATRVPPKFPPGTVEFNGHHYWLSPKGMPFDDAKKMAEDMGGWLVCIKTPEEQKLLEKLTVSGKSNQNYWIGLKRKSGDYFWDHHGKLYPIRFSAWESDKDRRRARSLHHFTSRNGGKWSPDRTGAPLHFLICEWWN